MHLCYELQYRIIPDIIINSYTALFAKMHSVRVLVREEIIYNESACRECICAMNCSTAYFLLLILNLYTALFAKMHSVRVQQLGK
jgi:hypothetical protein